jgi:hypothetical protein
VDDAPSLDGEGVLESVGDELIQDQCAISPTSISTMFPPRAFAR